MKYLSKRLPYFITITSRIAKPFGRCRTKGSFPLPRLFCFRYRCWTGYLPSLMRQYADTLVLLEPNPRCAERLRRSFDTVHTCLWGEPALHRMLSNYSQGFDLITMSHVLYHFNGLNDIRDKIRMALALLKPQGHLAIVLNQPSAPMARIGIGFQLAERRERAAVLHWQSTSRGQPARTPRSVPPSGIPSTRHRDLFAPAEHWGEQFVPADIAVEEYGTDMEADQAAQDPDDLTVKPREPVARLVRDQTLERTRKRNIVVSK